jgi:hypothetical protein
MSKTRRSPRTHPLDTVIRNLHGYNVNAARELKDMAISNRREATQQAARADRFYAKLKEIADIFGIECWTVATLPAKIRKMNTFPAKHHLDSK